MKILLRIVGGLAALVLLLVLVAYVLPRQYRIERAMVVNAKPEAVLTQVGDLRAWKNWGAWQERDPQMKLTYSTPSTGVGAWSAWESKREGNGKMTITEQTPTKVIYRLEFPDYDMVSTGTMELQPEASGTRVVWADAGDLGMNPMSRWFGLCLDRMVGADLDRGLVNMKNLVEK